MCEDIFYIVINYISSDSVGSRARVDWTPPPPKKKKKEKEKKINMTFFGVMWPTQKKKQLH